MCGTHPLSVNYRAIIVCDGTLRHDHTIDDVDDTVPGFDIGFGDICIIHHQPVSGPADFEALPINGFC